MKVSTVSFRSGSGDVFDDMPRVRAALHTSSFAVGCILDNKELIENACDDMKKILFCNF